MHEATWYRHYAILLCGTSHDLPIPWSGRNAPGASIGSLPGSANALEEGPGRSLGVAIERAPGLFLQVGSSDNRRARQKRTRNTAMKKPRAR
jgi:hypothetical protein